jgi:hypothetical protein
MLSENCVHMSMLTGTCDMKQALRDIDVDQRVTLKGLKEMWRECVEWI